MTNSSAQTTYYYTSEGDILSGFNSDCSITTSETITVDLGNISAAQTVTLTPSGLDTITLDGTSFTNIWHYVDVPFESSFPEWNDFQKMCKEYPGLEQAYEKLKTFYNLCKDEWEFKKKGLKGLSRF